MGNYLDCEWDWDDHSSSAVSLIQIGCSIGTFLFHNFDRLPPQMIKILGDAKIKKVLPISGLSLGDYS